jgi:transposase
MAPIPSEADEEARRAYREREDLTGERRSIVNKIEGILATLGIKGYKALRRDRREQLNCARQRDGDPIPPKARARIERLLDRLDLVLKLIEQVESARDAVLKKDAPADEAERMIRSLTDLRSIGPDFATLLVREAFVRQFRNRRALAGYIGLGGTPFSSGGSEREQGIGKDGYRRVRAAMVELAWMWLRWQPDSALSMWFRACRRNGRADQENHDRRSGSQAARRLVALCEGWRHPRRGKDESGEEAGAEGWPRNLRNLRCCLIQRNKSSIRQRAL